MYGNVVAPIYGAGLDASSIFKDGQRIRVDGSENYSRFISV